MTYKVNDVYIKNSDKSKWKLVTWGDASVTLDNGHSKEYPSHDNLKTQYTKAK